MKIALCWIGSVVVAVVLAWSPAFAETDRDRLAKMLKANGVVAYAGDTADEIRGAKVACICDATGAGLGFRAGYLAHYVFNQQVLVQCLLPNFNADGSAQLLPLACDFYQVIAK